MRMNMIITMIMMMYNTLMIVKSSTSKPQAYWLPPAMGATPDSPPLDPSDTGNTIPPNFSVQSQSTFLIYFNLFFLTFLFLSLT